VRTANPEDPEEPYGVAWKTAAERVWEIAKRGVAETAEQHLAAVDGIAALQMAVVVETGSVKLMSVRAPATILLA
jgi:hypothetical protein